jgi:hypothetical protein
VSLSLEIIAILFDDMVLVFPQIAWCLKSSCCGLVDDILLMLSVKDRHHYKNMADLLHACALMDHIVIVARQWSS